MFNNFFLKLFPLLRYVEKYGKAGHAADKKYNTAALHAGYLRKQTHTQNT
jgi:hypothetical protein